MKLLALIPARGGSRRLPRKNIRLLGEKPLITWSIDSVKEISDITDILVSTDDTAIAEIALDSGALVPWLRPADLATDTASTVDVALHALDWYEKNKEKVDGLLLLQPTSPFRTRDSILRGIDIFRTCQPCAVIGVSAAMTHPLWCFYIEDGLMKPYIGNEGLKIRSQDLPLAYAVNGAFYLIRPNDLKETLSFYTSNMYPLIMNKSSEGLDIDTLEDWYAAETLLSQ